MENYYNAWDEEQLDQVLQEMNIYIRVDPAAIGREIAYILELFKETYQYELEIEVEKDSFWVSSEMGYVAAHFEPIQNNPRKKYYTLLHNPEYKKYTDGFKFTLDFSDGILDSNGNPKKPGEIVTIAQSNNINTVTTELLHHWTREVSFC